MPFFLVPLQLVRAGDPAERVVLQFGKAEQDAFILDFNPMGARLVPPVVYCMWGDEALLARATSSWTSTPWVRLRQQLLTFERLSHDCYDMACHTRWQCAD